MIKQLTFAAITAVALTSFADAKSIVSATVSLKDGSSVNGEFLTGKVNGTTAFSKSLALDAAIVKSISFTGTNGEAKVELINSDRFAMTISNDVFAVRSMLGDLKIPRANFRSLTLASRSPVAKGGSGAGLIFHCTFDNREATLRPLKGKADVRILNATFERGKNGNAMRVQRGLPAIEVKLPSNTFGNKGCIEFWAKLLDGKTEFTTGGDPRFFTLYSMNGEACGGQVGVFEYASNSGNGNRGLWGGLLAGFAATHSGCGQLMPYSDIFHGKPYEKWHHYAISWNTSGVGSSSDFQSTDNVVLFIDGQKVSTVHMAGSSDMMHEMFNVPTLIGIPMQELGPSYNNKASFLIDDFKIWDFDKCEFDIN